jgi:nucleoside-diphosphate-sugar epimerase
MPGLPQIGFSFVDVRDVADLQIRAMTMPEGGGERFIAVAKFAWAAQVAEILRDNLGEDAAKVPTRKVPNLMVRAMGIFDPGVRSIVGQLGRSSNYSSEKARASLGWTTRPLDQTVVETARSMLD